MTDIHQQNTAKADSVRLTQNLDLTEQRLTSAILILRNRLNQIDEKLTEINAKLDILISR